MPVTPRTKAVPTSLSASDSLSDYESLPWISFNTRPGLPASAMEIFLSIRFCNLRVHMVPREVLSFSKPAFAASLNGTVDRNEGRIKHEEANKKSREARKKFWGCLITRTARVARFDSGGCGPLLSNVVFRPACTWIKLKGDLQVRETAFSILRFKRPH